MNLPEYSAAEPPSGEEDADAEAEAALTIKLLSKMGKEEQI